MTVIYFQVLDNRRPALELKHFKIIDQSSYQNDESSWTLVTKRITFEVPVIAVFTKYDQFLIDVGIDLEDRKDEDPLVLTYPRSLSSLQGHF